MGHGARGKRVTSAIRTMASCCSHGALSPCGLTRSARQTRGTPRQSGATTVIMRVLECCLGIRLLTSTATTFWRRNGWSRPDPGPAWGSGPCRVPIQPGRGRPGSNSRRKMSHCSRRGHEAEESTDPAANPGIRLLTSAATTFRRRCGFRVPTSAAAYFLTAGG